MPPAIHLLFSSDLLMPTVIHLLFSSDLLMPTAIHLLFSSDLIDADSHFIDCFHLIY